MSGPSGAWAKPLRARVRHFFPDDRIEALCGAYLLRDVKPSQFGADPFVRSCPTCLRKAGYFEAFAPLAGAGDPE